MKLKSDFVTNSSSTSFCLLGVSLTEEYIQEILGDKMYESYISRCKGENNTPVSKRRFLDCYYFTDEIREYISEYHYDLKVYIGEETGHWDIGKSPFLIEDDQTYLNFKECVVDQLEELGINISINSLKEIIDSYNC
jgi:hypothetical protein